MTTKRNNVCALYMPCFFLFLHARYIFEKIKTKLMGIYEYLFIFGILTVTCHNIFTEMNSIFGIFEFHFSIRVFFFFVHVKFMNRTCHLIIEDQFTMHFINVQCYKNTCMLFILRRLGGRKKVFVK